eukprot:10775648-Prorocentrum_lima.AAC.1
MVEVGVQAGIQARANTAITRRETRQKNDEQFQEAFGPLKETGTEDSICLASICCRDEKTREETWTN